MTPHDHFNALVALERPIATLNDGRGADPPRRVHQARSPRRHPPPSSLTPQAQALLLRAAPLRRRPPRPL